MTEKSKPEIYYTALKYFARTTQFLAWPIAFVFFNSLFKLKIGGRENLQEVRSPFIIISNHVSFYDSFVFRLVFGGFTRKLPLRFLAVNSFKTWYLNLLSNLFITDIIYALFGAFVVVKGRGIERNLVDAVRIIKNGGNVVIYPEGSIIYNGEIAQFKNGAAALAQKTDVPVIPVVMKIKGKSFRKDFVIEVGEGIEYNKDDSRDYITKLFRDTIVNLHNKE